MEVNKTKYYLVAQERCLQPSNIDAEAAIHYENMGA